MNKEQIQSLVNKLSNLAYRSHFELDEDCWYSCPLASNFCRTDYTPEEMVCQCGADEHNAIVNAAKGELLEALFKTS